MDPTSVPMHTSATLRFCAVPECSLPARLYDRVYQKTRVKSYVNQVAFNKWELCLVGPPMAISEAYNMVMEYLSDKFSMHQYSHAGARLSNMPMPCHKLVAAAYKPLHAELRVKGMIKLWHESDRCKDLRLWGQPSLLSDAYSRYVAAAEYQGPPKHTASREPEEPVALPKKMPRNKSQAAFPPKASVVEVTAAPRESPRASVVEVNAAPKESAPKASVVDAPKASAPKASVVDAPKASVVSAPKASVVPMASAPKASHVVDAPKASAYFRVQPQSEEAFLANWWHNPQQHVANPRSVPLAMASAAQASDTNTWNSLVDFWSQSDKKPESEDVVSECSSVSEEEVPLQTVSPPPGFSPLSSPRLPAHMRGVLPFKGPPPCKAQGAFPTAAPPFKGPPPAVKKQGALPQAIQFQ